MLIFEKFIPDNYNSLTLKEKKEAIIECVKYIFDSLDLEYIPVIFGNMEKSNDKEVAGKHLQAPCFICINNFFLDNSKFSKNDLDYHIYRPYCLLHTIAHECYHHYQYTLTQKLINGEELSFEDKNSAYLHFVCIYYSLFKKLNKTLHFSSKSTINEDDLYYYSPLEIQANFYADTITDILKNFDNVENYNYYKNLYISQQFNFMRYNALNGGNLIISSIENQLKLTLDFLKYKNATSGLKSNYLNIDPVELEKCVKYSINKWKKSQNRQNNFLNKIFKK